MGSVGDGATLFLSTNEVGERVRHRKEVRCPCPHPGLHCSPPRGSGLSPGARKGSTEGSQTLEQDERRDWP